LQKISVSLYGGCFTDAYNNSSKKFFFFIKFLFYLLIYLMLNNLSNELTQAHSSGKALLKELKAILKQRADAESEYARALERVA
jgi:hypothetical protein